MAEDPNLRASDADRDRVIEDLREAFAEGRITQTEFDDRLTQTHEARTYGELAPITADLPRAVPTPRESSPERQRRAGLRAGWGAWLGVGVLVNVIWLGTWLTGGGGPGYYWPIWVVGPWGAAMLIATLTGSGGDER